MSRLIHGIWYRSLRLLAQILFICVFQIRVFGRRNVPRTGGVLLASNHQSFLDPVLVGLGLWREVHFMARNELFERFSPFTRLITSLNAFPVSRKAADSKAIREAIRRLKEGNLLVVYPEGTRNDSGTLGTLMPGVTLVARKADCPIVPVAIFGAHRAWPLRYRVFHFCPIKVAFAPPIDPQGRGEKEVMEEVRKSIENMLSTLV